MAARPPRELYFDGGAIKETFLPRCFLAGIVKF